MPRGRCRASLRSEASDRRQTEGLSRIGQLRAEFRFIHLRAHLTTRALLTAEQIARYNAVRGYQDPGGSPHPHTR
jgi:hypothetical protein